MLSFSHVDADLAFKLTHTIAFLSRFGKVIEHKLNVTLCVSRDSFGCLSKQGYEDILRNLWAGMQPGLKSGLDPGSTKPSFHWHHSPPRQPSSLCLLVHRVENGCFPARGFHVPAPQINTASSDRIILAQLELDFL